VAGRCFQAHNRPARPHALMRPLPGSFRTPFTLGPSFDLIEAVAIASSMDLVGGGACATRPSSQLPLLSKRT